MLNIPASVKVYLAVDPCDCRKSFEGLSALVRQKLNEDPLEGGLFLFTNRRRSRLKVLYWDGTGLWVMCKRLEKGRFSWPTGLDVRDGKVLLSNRALALLLEGVDLKEGMKKVWYER